MTSHPNPQEIVNSIRDDMMTQIQWLKSCQILNRGNRADGAIALNPDRGRVTPYFANFAAMAMLEDPSAFELVERYLDWYLRHLKDDGTIPDCHYDRELNIKTTRPDSEDAYAGTYLSLVARYHRKTARTGWIQKNLPALKRVARVITRLMDRDGLTFALADYRVKYLMDNCEAYRGLADFAALLHTMGDREAPQFQAAARAIAAGVEKALWNRRRSCYHPWKGGWLKARIDLHTFYPDATCQLFPAIHGLIEPASERAVDLYVLFNRHQPDWVTIEPPAYPWMLLAYAACLHGDYTSAWIKIRHAREAYIASRSEYWYCAEAAFFVLTCALLLARTFSNTPD
ncbi:MAG: hypothetical protein IMW93_07345 [Thermoanaerobacteraceae bacterium]|nr:hypothetical protein [Thermoanaerobacteraceae bacterium]